jgi:hypothetical protein
LETLIEDFILDVTPKQVIRKRDGMAMTLYEVRMGDGTVYSTMFKETAGEAELLVGKRAKVKVKIEPKEGTNYINRYLQSVIGEIFTNGSVTSNTDLPATLQPDPPATYEDVQLRVKAAEDDKNARIARQTATKVAAMLMTATDSDVDFWRNVMVLCRFYDNGALPLRVQMALDET